MASIVHASLWSKSIETKFSNSLSDQIKGSFCNDSYDELKSQMCSVTTQMKDMILNNSQIQKHIETINSSITEVNKKSYATTTPATNCSTHIKPSEGPSANLTYNHLLQMSLEMWFHWSLMRRKENRDGNRTLLLILWQNPVQTIHNLVQSVT